MQNSRSILVFAAALVCAPAAAHAGEFEGVIEMKLTTSGGTGSMVMSIGKKGVRNEMNVQTPQFPMKMTMLFKRDTPDVAYTINDQDKTYGEIDTKKTGLPIEGQKYTAKKLGTEKINGWDTVHVLVTDEKGNETEVWTNKDIIDWRTFLSALGQNNGAANFGMMLALKSINADGFFVKLIAGHKGRQEKTTMELVKAEKKPMPASLFEIPKDYKKGEGAMAGVALPPEVQKQLMEKMKNMTPEQQEQIRRAMESQKQPR